MTDYDLIVIGGGPGGYVAAIRAAQLNMKVALVERDNVGGICLNWGCIPSKSLLRNAEVLNLVQHAEEFGITFDNLKYDFSKAIDRSRDVVNKLTQGVSYLLKKNKVNVITGKGILKNSNTIEITDTGQTLTSKNIIIATGARERTLPNLPIDGKIVITSREALEMRDVPPRVIIVGAGATGAEFAHIYRTYESEVTIVELLPSLIPNEDEDISKQLSIEFKKQGINILTGVKVENISTENNVANVNITDGDQISSIEAERVLIAIGISGNIEDIGLDDVGIATERGFIVVDNNMMTNVSSIYSIGDVTGKMPLAHVASAQGILAVENIAGLNPSPINYTEIPRAIYCKPQVASLGLTEAQARNQGHSIKIGKFPFAASGKAIALNETSGLIKLVIDSEIGDILGAHMIGAEVSELLGELALTNLLEGTITELGAAIHPHPTISEILKEAALDSEGEAIHI